MAEKKLIHIIDDEDSFRRSASFMLRASGFAVETWPTGPAFLTAMNRVERGCILLDFRLPEMDGLKFQAALFDHHVAMPIIFLTGHGNISVAVQAMKAGAVDFLEKPCEQSVLLAAIKSAFERLAAADERAARTAEAEDILSILTAREREVLEGLAQGLPKKTIAYDLGISPRTVEVYRANLMAKLDVHSLSDALRIAFAAGMGH
jgi:two-component system response regulator FixJ